MDLSISYYFKSYMTQLYYVEIPKATRTKLVLKDIYFDTVDTFSQLVYASKNLCSSKLHQCNKT